MNNFGECGMGGCGCLWLILLLCCCGGGNGMSCGNSGNSGCGCNIIPVLVALCCCGGCGCNN